MSEGTRREREFHFDLFADYFQFYLQDEQADLAGSEGIWTDRSLADMVAVAPGQLLVSTVRNMTVSVTVMLTDSEPIDDFAAWDHVIDAGLDVPSGRIVIAGCTDSFFDAARIAVPVGRYRVRVYYGRLDSIDEEYGLDGDDHYQVVLWPASDEVQPSVLKRWVSSRTYDVMTRNPLIGTWRLASYQCKDANGQTTFPLGERPSGFMIYGSQGYMSLVVSADRQRSISPQTHNSDEPIEYDDAQVGFLAYSGRYDFTGPNVEHHVDVSSLPNWVGALLTYSVSFTGFDGKQRVNHFARTNVDSTEKQFAWWTWERVDSTDHTA
ncbi:MAG: lipocalin-like domain-containing protein [Thermomicrobiales bacterium]